MKGGHENGGDFINSQFLFLLPGLNLPHLELIKALKAPSTTTAPLCFRNKKWDEKNILFPQNPLPPPPISV